MERLNAIPAGPRRFSIDIALPQLRFGGMTIRIENLETSHDGAVFGGRAVVAPAWHADFGLRLERLSGPTRFVFGGCHPATPPPATLQNTSCFGSAVLTGAGTLCEYEILSPATDLNSVLSVEIDGDDAAIAVDCDYGTAVRRIRQPLRILVRTACGVRLVDLGLPPAPEYDESGALVNVHDIDLAVCVDTMPLLKPDQLTPKDYEPVPLEWPGWRDFLANSHRVAVHLVTLNRLEPGELVQLRTPADRVDVTADGRSSAGLPVLVPVTAAISDIRLGRVNQQPLAGHAEVVIRELPPSGALLRSDAASRRDEDVAVLGEHLRLKDLDMVAAVPGFEDASIKVAVLESGGALVVDLASPDGPRIAGTFGGPIGPV